MIEPFLNLHSLVLKCPLYKMRFKTCDLHLHSHVLGNRENVTIFHLKKF